MTASSNASVPPPAELDALQQAFGRMFTRIVVRELLEEARFASAFRVFQ